MRPIFLDFETYWDTHHSLTKMSPTEYVMSDKTEIISCAIKEGMAGETYVVFGEKEIGNTLNKIDWSDAMCIGHNMSGFDSMIMAWRYGINPKMWGCTAAMARSEFSKTEAFVGGRMATGVSLKKLAAELTTRRKLDLEATNTKGKYLRDFTPEEIEMMREYNKIDTELCAELFGILVKRIPKNELVQIDMTVRMLTEPQFELDFGMVSKAHDQCIEDQRQMLLKLATQLNIADFVAKQLKDGTSIEEQVRAELSSAAKFSALLKNLGVEVPMKPSPTNEHKMTPALAKTDEAFIKLQDHPNPLVAAAARARLDVKSTILQTRLEAFILAARSVGGKLPVPLKYAGADTTGRWSGEQYNMQNLPRIPRDKEGNIIYKPSNALRLSLCAPKNHKIIVADQSGIELRVNHFLWKVPSSMALYAGNAEADLYRAFAAARYGIEPDQVSKDQRQLAKVAQLGLGFGAGAPTFRKVAKLMGGLDLSEEESLDIVNSWRDEYKEIVKGWQAFQDALPHILQGVHHEIDPWGMCIVEKGAVRLPSGRKIHYPNLGRQRENGKTEWWYGCGRTKARIYAGKGVENLVQALARDIIAENALKFRRLTGFSPALTVHDELVYVVPQAEAKDLLAELQNIMRTPVDWWPDLITWSDGDMADRYGEAK